MYGSMRLVVLIGIVSSVAAYTDDIHRISIAAGDCATLDHELIPDTNYQIFIDKLRTNGCAANLVTYVINGLSYQFVF